MLNKIETERLFLRELIHQDALGLFELDSNPEVHRYLGTKPLVKIEQAKEIIQMIRQQYIDNGIGRWAVIEKKSGDFMGWAGLKLIKEEINGHSHFYDLGYRLIPKYWAQGYATEAGMACLNYGFSHQLAETLYAFTDAENLASQKVLQKLGFVFKESFLYENDKHHWYKIKKENNR